MSNKNMSVSRETHKQMAKKNAVKLLAVLVGFEVGLVMLFLLALIIVTSADWWYHSESFAVWKPLLRVITYAVFAGLSIMGCYYIAYRFQLKPLEYLDDVTEAAQLLATPTEAPVSLPPDLKKIEDDLNTVRIQTLESQKAAQEAEKRRDDLLVYLAHDLKTPLTSVLGYLKLLEDEPDISPELISKYTGIARDKAERLEELINEFFEITRFSTNKLTLEPALTNLSRMLMQITYEFNPVLKDKNLKWNIQIPENIELLCDADKLERAIDNLIRNAINYSFNDSIIQFTLVQLENSVQICVENTGNTIPPEKLEKIFEQFYRLDIARSSNTGGAGLGLAIAKEIVELHHGIITAYSADERIRFTIQLPLDCQKIV
ncbi:sensor histidine kinase [Murimonas intestini]|uniref:sensor histidine kinase n=1 Tax=Murimonas intestini TaxID=1337051 RepID=UPI001FAAF16E|nr:HAMP domain-containing sensor histidine kinase [Murimonas intestini]